MKNWLTRTILVLSLVSLFNDISGELLYPVLPLYLASIGYGAVWIGILEGCAEAVGGLTKGWFGEWSDRRGQRLPFVRFGYLISTFSKPLLVLFASAPWAVLMRSSDRLGKGVRTGARDALLAEEAGENKGKAFGFHRALDTLGAVIGPVLALTWLSFHKNGDYKPLFYYALAPGLLCYLLLFLVKEKKQERKKVILPASPFSSFGYWKRADKEYRKLLAGVTFFTLFNSSDMFLLLLVKTVFKDGITMHINGPVAVSADMLVVGFYIFYNIIYSLASYPAGIMSDKAGPKRMMIIGYICFGLTYGGMAAVAAGWTHSILFVLACFVIYGFYAACTEGISKAWVSQLSAKEDKGLALGLFSGYQSIAMLIASSVAGLIWTFTHPSFVFLSSALVSGIIVFYLTFALKSTRPERQE